MSVIKITDLDGNYVNQINADLSEAKDVYPNHKYEEINAPALTMADMLSPEGNAKMWRDEELQGSDWVVSTTDHPQHAAYITYRAALRDWPSVDSEGEYINDFPATKPTLGE